MTKLIVKTSKKAGLSPGSLVHIGEKRLESIRISLVDYDESHLTEMPVESPEAMLPFLPEPSVTWMNICGVHDTRIIEDLEKQFQIHPLTLEDIVNTAQRPKVESYDHYLFVVLKTFRYDSRSNEVASEQISLILGENYLITFQETASDIFANVVDRLRKGTRIRKRGADYLAYALIDAVVDSYFAVLEALGEKIETLEEELLESPGSGVMEQIHKLKRNMIFLRKQIWPIREILGFLTKEDSHLIQDSTVLYFRDVHDHTIQLIDTIESFRDILSGMLDVYLSTISNKMNEVMKVLTIIATIFIPITFFAGVYGMNFRFMPELDWKWGYPAFWLLVGLVTYLMITYFRKKNWL